MRRPTVLSVLLLASVIGVGFTISSVQAQQNNDQNQAQQKKHQGKKHKRMSWEQRQYQRLQERLFKDITLTSDQQTKVKADFDAYIQARQAFHKQHAADIKTLREQMKQARQAKDKEKLKALRKQWRDLMAQAPKMKDTIDKMRTELTADQQTQFDENLKAMHKPRHHKKGDNANKKNKKKDNGQG